MEKDLLNWDIPRFFVTWKKHLQDFQTLISSHERLEKKIDNTLKIPSFGALLHIQEISELLDVTQNTIYRYIRSGELASIKIGNRHVFYEEDIKDFLDKNYKKRRRS